MTDSYKNLKKAFVEAILEQVAVNNKLTEDVDYNNMSEKEKLEAVKKNPGLIKYIDNPSEEVQLAAVEKSGALIEYIIKKGIQPSENVQLIAVKDKRTPRIMIMRNNKPYYVTQATWFIKNPSEQVQLAAVENNPYDILLFANPSEEVQLAAVQQVGGAIKCIQNPYPSVIKYVNEHK